MKKIPAFTLLFVTFTMEILAPPAVAASSLRREWQEAMDRFSTVSAEQEAELKEEAASEIAAAGKRQALAQKEAHRAEMVRFCLLAMMFAIGSGLTLLLPIRNRRARKPVEEPNAKSDRVIGVIPSEPMTRADSYVVNADAITITSIRELQDSLGSDEITQTTMVPKDRRYLAQRAEQGWVLHEIDRHGRPTNEVGLILDGSRVRGSVLGKSQVKNWYELRPTGEWAEVAEHGKCILSIKQTKHLNKNRHVAR